MVVVVVVTVVVGTVEYILVLFSHVSAVLVYLPFFFLSVVWCWAASAARRCLSMSLIEVRGNVLGRSYCFRGRERAQVR